MDAHPTASGAVTSRPSVPMEPLGTDELVERARSGDREAYAMLFERYHDEIYRFATRRVGDPVAGQDVAADTFADGFRSIHRFKPRGVAFEAWLYTIARRRVADHLRARGRVLARGDLPEAAAADHGPAVVEALHLRGLIERLPDAEREAIELRFMEDLDVEAAALRLGRTPGAVRVAQHRALQRLRGMMAEGDVA